MKIRFWTAKLPRIWSVSVLGVTLLPIMIFKDPFGEDHEIKLKSTASISNRRYEKLHYWFT